MSRRPKLNDEDGFALLEVIVSAALLAVMIVAVFTSFDFANRNSAADRARAVAASLAEADQERMRGLPVATMSAIADQGPQPQPDKTVDGYTYKITSTADWIADATQTQSCESNGAAADYMKVRSTVSTPNARIKPVTVTSLVTPSAGTFGAGQGSLAVSILNAAGAGKPGVAVTLSKTGSSGQTRTTDNDGCAFFGYLPTGSYALGVAAAGHVDVDDVPTISDGVEIASEAMSTASYKYDVADSVQVLFDTQKVDSSGITSTLVPARARYVRFENGSQQKGPQLFGDGTAAASMTAANLFPFTDGYTAYAGNCDGAKPTAPATILATASGPPSVTVRVPTVLFNNVKKSGTAVVAPVVKLTATGTSCSGTMALQNTSAGRAWDALPYGTYSYCASDGSRKVTGTVNLNNANGVTVTPPDLQTGLGAGNGSC
jgi:type II secretory pathway pseudopilin PulG